MSELFLGVDGGQSSTTAVIGDASGRVLASGTGGPCNHVRHELGRQRFLSAIRDSVSQACSHAGLDLAATRFSHAFFGLSGGPAERREIIEEVLHADHIHLAHDGLVALAGAHAGSPGIILIAGTGSIAFGRNSAGRFGRAGGWGYVYGDEGASFDIARQAVRAILRAEEGWGPATSLTATLLAETSQSSANNLLHALYSDDFPRSRVARFAPLVDQAALAGDPVARDILASSAQSLTLYASAVRRQLFAPAEPVRTAYIGGAFRSTFLLERFRTLVELEEGSSVVAPLYGPALGALIEAWRAAGLTPTPTGNLP
jgi:N-acetylglucosamine kinase-like BadF-type ATPase